MFFQRLLILFIAGISLSGCIYFSDHAPDVSHVKVKLSLKKLENELFACQSKNEIRDFLEELFLGFNEGVHWSSPLIS